MHLRAACARAEEAAVTKSAPLHPDIIFLIAEGFRDLGQREKALQMASLAKERCLEQELTVPEKVESLLSELLEQPAEPDASE